MADEFRYLDPNATTLTNLSGAVEDTHEDPTTTQIAWLTAGDPGLATQVDGTFNAPSAGITGTQIFRVRARSTNNGGGGAAITITMDDGSTPVSSVALSPGEVRVFDDADGLSLDAGNIADPNAVDITIDGASGGGMPGSRDVVEVGAVEWAVTLNQFLEIFTYAPTGVGPNQATYEGEVDFGGYNSVDVWFEWGEVGAGFPNSTTRQEQTQSTTFSELVDTLSSDTAYEVRAHVETGDASTTDTGTTHSFVTPFVISGTVDSGGTGVDGATVHISDVHNPGPVSDLYNEGTENVPWVEGHTSGGPTLSKESDHLYGLAGSASSTVEGTWVTDIAIDLTDASTVSVDWENTGADDTSNRSYLIASTNKTGDSTDFFNDPGIEVQGIFSRQTDNLDVSSVSGEHYIRVHVRDAGTNFEATSELLTYGVSLDTTVQAIPTAELTATLTTDPDGTYSTEVPGGRVYHVAAQHDDGTDQYAGASYPHIQGPGGD